MSVHEIIKHITTVHNINKNDIHNNVSEYISSKLNFRFFIEYSDSYFCSIY